MEPVASLPFAGARKRVVIVGGGFAGLKLARLLDRGSMAMIGRNLAVADLRFMRFSGFTAWVLWLFVHLMSIVGTKNRVFIFLTWMWSYITFDQSLRLVIKTRNTRQGEPG